MEADGEYTLKIEAYSPATLPMARLAEYMGDLARLLGEEKSVHFVRLDNGSTAIVHRVEREAVPKVRDRIITARGGVGPDEPRRAIQSINRRLAEDNGTGVLKLTDGAEILRFPGREDAESIQGAITEQEESIDGVVVRVGGVKQWIGVHIQDREGRVSACLAKKDTAKQLAMHIFGQEVRLFGVGKWSRMFGAWRLDKFYVETFRLLDETPAEETVARLQAIEGSEWRGVPDVLAELERIRSGQDGAAR